MKQEWDVVIVGAGPAGSMLALCLAETGISVLLVDRAEFPRYKVCGGCLNLSALGSLREVGLGQLLGELGAPQLHSLRLSVYGEKVDLDLPGGHAVSRSTFDFALVRKALDRGIAFRSSTKARLIENNSDGCTVELLLLRPERRRHLVRSKIVVAADGISDGFLSKDSAHRSQISRNSRVGVGCLLKNTQFQIPPGELRMAVGREGYVGAVGVEKGHVDVAAAIDTESIAGGAGSIGEVVSRILNDNGSRNLAESLRHAAWKGTPLLSRRRKRLGGTRLFFVGDAAGYVEPFTGEGIAWALMGGHLVAPIVSEAIYRWNPNLVDSWQDAHREVIRTKQRFCQVARFVLRHPLPTRFLIRLARLNPRWAIQVIESISHSAGQKAATL